MVSARTSPLMSCLAWITWPSSILTSFRVFPDSSPEDGLCKLKTLIFAGNTRLSTSRSRKMRTNAAWPWNMENRRGPMTAPTEPFTRAPAGKIIWLPRYTGWATSATNGSPFFATAVVKLVSKRRCTWVPCRSSWDCARAGITAAASNKTTAPKDTAIRFMGSSILPSRPTIRPRTG